MKSWGLVKNGALAIALAAMQIPSIAHAEEGPYAAANFGVGVDGSGSIEANAPIASDIELNGTYVGEIDLGYEWDGGWRLQAEVSHLTADIAPTLLANRESSLKATGLMLGAYKEFGNGSVRPYVGAAAGIGWLDLRVSSDLPLVPVLIDESDSTFAFKLSAGASVKLSERLDLDFGYRYFNMSGFEGTAIAPATGGSFPVTQVPAKADISSHMITAGLRISF